MKSCTTIVTRDLELYLVGWSSAWNTYGSHIMGRQNEGSSPYLYGGGPCARVYYVYDYVPLLALFLLLLLLTRALSEPKKRQEHQGHRILILRRLGSRKIT